PSIGPAHSAAVNQSAHLVRVVKVITVQENKIGNRDHGLSRHSAKARADKKTPDRAVYPASRAFLDPLNEFVNPVRAKDGVIVSEVQHAEVGDVGLVVDLDKDVAVAVIEYPVRRAVASAKDGVLVGQALIL